MNENSVNQPGSKDRNTAIFSGIVLVTIGLLFLLHSIVPGFSMAQLWPLFLLVPVVILLSVLLSKGKEAAGVVIPIGILSTLVVYFMIMNYAGWDSAKYTWPVFILAPAVGFYAFFLITGDKGILIPAGILTLLAAIFFGIIFNSINLVGVCFVAAGLIIIISSFIKGKKHKQV